MLYQEFLSFGKFQLALDPRTAKIIGAMLCFRKQRMRFTYYWMSIYTSSAQVQH